MREFVRNCVKLPRNAQRGTAQYVSHYDGFFLVFLAASRALFEVLDVAYYNWCHTLRGLYVGHMDELCKNGWTAIDLGETHVGSGNHILDGCPDWRYD